MVVNDLIPCCCVGCCCCCCFAKAFSPTCQIIPNCKNKELLRTNQLQKPHKTRVIHSSIPENINVIQSWHDISGCRETKHSHKQRRKQNQAWLTSTTNIWRHSILGRRRMRSLFHGVLYNNCITCLGFNYTLIILTLSAWIFFCYFISKSRLRDVSAVCVCVWVRETRNEWNGTQLRMMDEWSNKIIMIQLPKKHSASVCAHLIAILKC